MTMNVFILALFGVCSLVTADEDNRLPNKCEGKEEKATLAVTEDANDMVL